MLWLYLLCNFVIIHAQYEVPTAIVEVFSPKGFKVSIPDQEGIKLFAFHGKINEEMNGREAGTFSRDILKAKNGRWTFSDTGTKLKVGDIIYYWTYVEYKGIGYPNDDQMFTVTELIPQTTSTIGTTSTTTTTPVYVPEPETSAPPPSDGTCEPSPTVYKGRSSCKGKLIFSDAFTTEVRRKFWTAEQKFAGGPDYEFVIYVNRSDNLYIQNRRLKLKPVPIEDIYGHDFVNTPFDLGDSCTGVVGSQDCCLKPEAGFILPPVLSSQISTKQKFSFKYGKVEIKAKLPKGDWIYPELYLNPLNEEYGTFYDSGQIRIAFTPGNADSNKILHGGIILGQSPAARTFGMKSVERQSSWTSEFHKFTVVWKPDSITLSVDDKVYGTVYPPAGGFASLGTNYQIKNADRWKAGTQLAPFDKEMYISIGVGVGGFSFADRADGTKPWRNGERLSTKKFYNAEGQWKPTWSEDSQLEIDHVKVWAI